MDFVPTKSSNTSVTHTKKPAAPVVTTHKTTKISSTASRPVRTMPAPALGVIEDLSPRTNKTRTRQSVAKAPIANKSTLKSIKSQKIGNRAPVKPVENHVENSAKKSLKDAPKHTFVPPKFINQDKITKRPLSKNVYRKKIEPAKEFTKKPITIITKPEKDTKVGLVVTIIITIILGAAAGTVAFLLLPK